jgi:hypothetical protein
MRKLLLLCAFALSAVYASAQTCQIIYVTTDGSSGNPGTIASPKDIVSAFADAQDNQVICIAAGTYNLDAPGREVSFETFNNVSAVQSQLPAQNGLYLIYMTVNDQVIVKRVVKN